MAKRELKCSTRMIWIYWTAYMYIESHESIMAILRDSSTSYVLNTYHTALYYTGITKCGVNRAKVVPPAPGGSTT